MSVYNYRHMTYKVTGMSVINDPKDTKQEGILIHLKAIDFMATAPEFQSLDLFLDKRDVARIAKTVKDGRRFWKRFRLPKMVVWTEPEGLIL